MSEQIRPICLTLTMLINLFLCVLSHFSEHCAFGYIPLLTGVFYELVRLS